ncbi:hypothetical protein LSAT2_020888 [Lamellibrachia satsuma]|nr:hypothetical protein LSAT2_020888 [Lamellibrachia satsuma]
MATRRPKCPHTNASTPGPRCMNFSGVSKGLRHIALVRASVAVFAPAPLLCGVSSQLRGSGQYLRTCFSASLGRNTPALDHTDAGAKHYTRLFMMLSVAATTTTARLVHIAGVLSRLVFVNCSVTSSGNPDRKHNMRWPSLLLAFASVVGAVVCASALLEDCPAAGEMPCRCWRTQEDMLGLDCNNMTVTTPPSHLPMTTVVLGLNNNQIEKLPSGVFSRLHRLTDLDVSNNQIRHISSDAFKLLPKLTQVDLTGNPLQCDCEMKRLRDWVLGLLPPLFLVGPNCANLRQSNLFTVDDEQFGNCDETTIDKQQKCLNCFRSTSQTECEERGHLQSCPQGSDACETIIRTSGGHQWITKQCQQSTSCLSKLKANPVNCSEDSSPSLCQFCCASATCNSNADYPGYLYTVTFGVSFVMRRPYLSNYDNSTSLELQKLQAELNISLTELFTKLASREHTLSQTRFRDVSKQIRFECLLKTHSPLGQRAEALREALLAAWYRIFVEGFKNHLLIERNSIIISVHSDIAQCPRQVTDDTLGVFVWPRTKAGVTAQVMCPGFSEVLYETYKFATRKCDLDADGLPRWTEPDLSSCRSGGDSNITKQLRDLLKTHITKGNVGEILKSLATVTNTSGQLSQVDVGYSAEILSTVLNTDIKLDINSATAVIQTYNNMLQVDINTLTESQQQFNGTEKLLRSLEQVASRLVLPPSGQMTIVHGQIAIAVLQVASLGDTEGVRFGVMTSPMGGLLHRGVSLETNTTITSSQNADSAIYLPGYLLRNASTDLVQFTIFESDKFFKSVQRAASLENSPSTGSSASVSSRTTSHVIAASFTAIKFTDLPKPVSITLQHLRWDQHHTVGQPVCVFWDFTAGRGPGTGGNWSTRGCTSDPDTDSHDSTTCLCDHLTNFALLLDVYDQGSSLDPEHQVALSVISYIGCGISLLAVTLTLITLLTIKKLYRTENPSKILTHLCFALVGVLILFILGTQSFVRNHSLACKIFAGAMHYFLLATWLWMAVEAFYMYHALVKVFQTYYSRFLLKSILIAWGVPLIAVAITAGINTDNYKLQGNM